MTVGNGTGEVERARESREINAVIPGEWRSHETRNPLFFYAIA
jgi:hypothetical protein